MSWYKITSILGSRLFIAFALMLLAGLLRFYKLGAWPMRAEEYYTLIEEKALFENTETSKNSQIYRLPRIIPLSHLFHHINNTLFGRDEFGSRVVSAVMGTVIPGIVFILLDILMGRPTAIATALLLSLLPEHIFQSQDARFYVIADLFSFCCMLFGALAVKYKSTPLYIVTCCLVIVSILCHTLTGVLLGIIFTGIVAASYAERRPIPWKIYFLFLATGMVMLLYYVFYLKPLITGWNEGGSWGYGTVHAVLGSLNAIGWPVALLGAAGFLLLLFERNAQNWYWVSCAAGWAAASVILPLFVVYHPEYVFPLSLGVLVLAGSFIGAVYDYFRTKHILIGVAWIALACIMNLPSLASYYLDGSRIDIRTSAQYVRKNWQSGDRVAGLHMGLFEHYAKDCKPTISLSLTEPIPQLQELIGEKGRLWIVLGSNRGGLQNNLQHWLGTHCSHELKVRRTRFDYAEYQVDVFLWHGKLE